MTHQLITEILFLSKEKTGLKYPIKERMEGNLLLLIHGGSPFEALQSNTFLRFFNRAPLMMLLAQTFHIFEGISCRTDGIWRLRRGAVALFR